jgi:hypothetical protein
MCKPVYGAEFGTRHRDCSLYLVWLAHIAHPRGVAIAVGPKSVLGYGEPIVIDIECEHFGADSIEQAAYRGPDAAPAGAGDNDNSARETEEVIR